MHDTDNITLLHALENAIGFLEHLGYTDGGSIHDDLVLAKDRIETQFPDVAEVIL